MCSIIEVSPLRKTWILDIDGTIAKHNGYIVDGYDSILPGIHSFLEQIHAEDMVILITSRQEEYRSLTENFLREQKIRYNHIIFGAPYGERILVNDKKASGLKTSIALNTIRNEVCQVRLKVNENL